MFKQFLKDGVLYYKLEYNDGKAEHNRSHVLGVIIIERSRIVRGKCKQFRNTLYLVTLTLAIDQREPQMIHTQVRKRRYRVPVGKTIELCVQQQFVCHVRIVGCRVDSWRSGWSIVMTADE